MTDPDFDRVAAVFTAFANSTDLYEMQQMVADEGAVLFSGQTERYVDALIARYGSDPKLLAGIRARWQLLQSCRSDGVQVAFANFFADLHSEPISEAAVAVIRQHAESPDRLVQALADQPGLMPDVQRAVAANNFISAMTTEMQTPEAMSNPGRRIILGRTALRLADSRLDPDTWAAIRGELANALTNSDAAADLEEAVALLRSLLPFYSRAGDDTLHSTTLHNLGQALGKRNSGTHNEDLIEAVRYLEQALTLRLRAKVPFEWAQTQYALALVRRRWLGPDRAAQIEMALQHLEQALEEWSPESAHDAWILATSDLADVLMRREKGRRVDNLERAIGLLESAIVRAPENTDDWIVSLQARLEYAYQQLAVGKSETEKPAGEEILFPDDLDGWVCRRRVQTAAQRIEEWVLGHASLNDWRELVTTDVICGAGAMPFRGLLVSVERMLHARITTGDFTFRRMHESADSLTYVWSVEGDFAIEDQYELVRIMRGEDGLHRLHRAVRGKSFSHDTDEIAQWILRLANAVLSRRSDRASVVLVDGQRAGKEEIQERLARLSGPSSAPIDDPEGYLKDILRGVGRGDEPEMYATLNLMGALKLLQSEPAPSPAETEEGKRRFRHGTLTPEEQERVSYGVMRLNLRAAPEAIEVAIRALRSSLEVFSRDTHPKQWAMGVSNLARAFLARTVGDPQSNIARARFGSEQAAEVFATLQMKDQLADVNQDLGRIHSRLAAAGDPREYGRALEYFSSARQTHTRESHPLEWAQATLNIAEVCEALAQESDGDQALLGVAEKEYDSVVECLLSDDRLSDGIRERIASGITDPATMFLSLAVKALERLDRARFPTPRTPAGFDERRTRGNVLFLRPLISARTLLLENRFRDPGSFAVQFDVEPAALPLESVLNRALLEHVGFHAVGGSPEGFGGGRSYSIGIGDGWKDAVAAMMNSADLILMVPHDSPGVRWEVEQLNASKALVKTVFVMPPASPGLDVAALWSDAAPVMQGYGFELPPYRDDGLLFRLGENGRVAESFLFGTVWDNTLFQHLEPLFPAVAAR